MISERFRYWWRNGCYWRLCCVSVPWEGVHGTALKTMAVKDLEFTFDSKHEILTTKFCYIPVKYSHKFTYCIHSYYLNYTNFVYKSVTVAYFSFSTDDECSKNNLSGPNFWSFCEVDQFAIPNDLRHVNVLMESLNLRIICQIYLSFIKKYLIVVVSNISTIKVNREIGKDI